MAEIEDKRAGDAKEDDGKLPPPLETVPPLELVASEPLPPPEDASAEVCATGASAPGEQAAEERPETAALPEPPALEQQHAAAFREALAEQFTQDLFQDTPLREQLMASFAWLQFAPQALPPATGEQQAARVDYWHSLIAREDEASMLRVEQCGQWANALIGLLAWRIAQGFNPQGKQPLIQRASGLPPRNGNGRPRGVG